MLIRLLRHEWRALRADATVWVIAAVCAAMIGYAMTNGVRWVAFQRTALAEAAAEETHRYDRMKTQINDLQRTGGQVSPFADPRSPSVVGGRLGPRYATLPPAPLASLAIGQSDLLPYYFKVSTDARETIVAAAEIENPHRLLVGRLDLAFVLVFLYPLLILAVSYNMLSAEKEQGTLALALSQPVSLGTLAASKVVLRALVLIGIVVIFSILALLAGGASLSAPGAGAPDAVGGRSGGIWNAVVRAGRVRRVAGAAIGGKCDDPRDAVARARRDAPVALQPAGDDVLSGAMNDFNVIRVAVDDDVTRRVRPVVARYEQQIAGQQRLIERLRFLVLRAADLSKSADPELRRGASVRV